MTKYSLGHDLPRASRGRGVPEPTIFKLIEPGRAFQVALTFPATTRARLFQTEPRCLLFIGFIGNDLRENLSSRLG
jgi:hypothetical protein